MVVSRFLSPLCLVLALALPPTLLGQLNLEQRLSVAGTVTAIKPGEITIVTDDDQTLICKIQDEDQRAISLAGHPVNLPAKISVSGQLPIELAEPGMQVAFSARCNVYGKSNTELSQVTVLLGDKTRDLQVDFQERPQENSDFALVHVVGQVIYCKNNKLLLKVPKGKWARRERISFKTKPDATMKINDDSMSRVIVGDHVKSARLLKFDTGEIAVQSIDIELTAEREAITTSFDDQLEYQFSDLSDDPGQPRELRSEHFILYTDLSDRSAHVLMEKLERMFDLVSGYFQAAPKTPIECFVVRDLSQWPPGRIDPVGAAKIREGAGVTASRRMGRNAQAIVFSCEDHRVVQHEAVHAFCVKTFGATGPTWYSEGMAEMGNYWEPGNLAVNIDPIVINYLTNSPARTMAEIVAAGQITGDSWKAYAWRWALCHLLASNPNYQDRFKVLGVNMMSGRNDSFTAAFGEQASEISFEYDQFVKHFGNGYRVDLCAWDWKTRPLPMSGSRRVKHHVKAKSGWQATKLLAEQGQAYDYVALGEWSINPQTEVDADGADSGAGRLVGVILKDYQLSEPFELGARGSFTAPQDGQLFVRCRDRWTALADNDGTVELHLRKSKSE